MNAGNLEKIKPGKAIVVYSSKIPISELNFRIIKHIVSDGKGYILFISVEKPHNYMTYILGMHRVSQRNITYLDAINTRNLRFPITIKDMKSLQIGGFLRREIIILKDYNYVIVDHVEHLQHTWSEESIRECLESLKRDAAKYNVGVIIPVKDPSSNIGKIVDEMCEMKIEMDEVRK